MQVRGTDAIAFEAAAALDAYEEQLTQLRRHGADPGRIGAMQAALRRAGSLCLRLPHLSGASLALLLSHHRLLADLARAGDDARLAATAPSLEPVEECVRDLQRLCRELFLASHLQ
ncbi:MAG TPA: hypothetical protein VGD76_06870 [Ramlibacter sp.]